MKYIIKPIKTLKNSKIKNLVNKRIKEFKQNKNYFSELSFCLLTANFNAERSIKIQNEIGNGFKTFSESKLSKRLRELGHRFPNARSNYIVEARKHKLGDKIRTLNETELREWLVKNIKGLGMKEASHFLRNIGYINSAIIDFHIIDLLVKYDLIKRPKTLTKKKYLEIENILRIISKKVNLNLSELDLYLWYMETGKILK